MHGARGGRGFEIDEPGYESLVAAVLNRAVLDTRSAAFRRGALSFLQGEIAEAWAEALGIELGRFRQLVGVLVRREDGRGSVPSTRRL